MNTIIRKKQSPITGLWSNILDQDFQFEIIDAFSNNNEIVNEFRLIFNQFQELQRKIEKLCL